MWSLFKNKEQKAQELELAQRQREEFEKQRQIEKQKEQEQKTAIKNNYEAARRNYGYTKGHNGIVSIKGKKYYAFVSDNHFKLFICQPKNWELSGVKKMHEWQRQAISLSNIKYFTREGKVYTETKISGGGSTGPNIGGAIIGGIIAGGVGAIIGGQSKIEPIKSETISRDNRKTVLVYNKGKIEFAPEDHSVLMKLIPDKELSVVQQKIAENKTSDSIDPTEQLRNLKSLHDDGLLTDEEFEKKRKKLVELL